MSELTPGQHLASRFELIRLLGRGGMGEVWLARDAELGEDVAVKVLDQRLTGEPGMLELLRHECRQARRLVHPNIVKVYDFHQADGRSFISMEYVAGGELGRLRDAQPAEVLTQIVPLADALAYAHSQGVVHRDLKPSNVLIDRDGKSRLVDFGVAGLLQGDDKIRIKGGGSPLSMSPEQRAGQPPSPADDAFSLGVLIYELISGFPPRVAADLAPPEPMLSRMNYSIPERLQTLVRRLLAPDAAGRPTGMAQVRDELAAALEECWSQTTPPQVRVRGPEAPPDETIVPLPPRPVASTGPQESADQRRLKVGIAWGAFAVLIALLLVVLLVLPDYVAQRNGGDTAVEVRSSADQQAALERLAAEKDEANQARDDFGKLGQSLVDRGVEEWAASDYQDALALSEAAQKAYDGTQFVTARETWESGIEALRALDQRASELLADSLARGQTALLQGRRAEAEREFGMAVKLDPGNQVAGEGMARAEHIEEVIALMAQGLALERDGKLEEARDSYRRVTELDPVVEEAPAAIKRIDNAIVQRRYTEAMSVGYASLGIGDFEEARKAFRRAARIRPGATEPAEGLKRVQDGERVTGIETHRERAAAFEADEQWQKAVDEYQAALAIDPGIAFAQEGVRRAGVRAELDSRLEAFLASPERLYSQDVLISAGKAIQEAGAVEKPGPRLVNQATRLAALMEESTQPVTVTLESDKLTDVVVFRVGRIGTFERFQLQLKPGTYTLLGTRAGYRDVRREVTIKPGQATGPVMIRCEERI